MTDTTSDTPDKRVSTGLGGFDDIVNGGLLDKQNYLVRGAPGTGKSTLGMHFLSEGVANGEESLYINFGEKQHTIKRAARNFGFPIEEITILDLSPQGEDFVQDDTYDIFSSAEVEGQPLSQEIASAIEDQLPTRVFVDPVTQLRHLTPDEFQFRKQMLSLFRYLTDHGATVLFTSQDTSDEPDEDLQFLSDGIIRLDSDGEFRTIEVTKFRGSDFAGGIHSMNIGDSGLEVYPQLPLIRRTEPSEARPKQLSSGIPGLDQLLGGGIERGTTTLVSGPSGVGKSTLASAFANAAAGRGQRSTFYLFEESVTTLVHRSRATNIPINEMRDQQSLILKPVETLSLDQNEFANRVKNEVEQNETDIVVIDGIEGYSQAVKGGDVLKPIHRLVRYLSSMDVTTFLIAETKDVTGGFSITEHGGSYLADNVVFLRHIEVQGEMRKTIGVLKKRMSDFERTLREYQITEHGIRIGEPMTDLRGTLTGTPEFVDLEEQEIEFMQNGGR